MSLQQVVSSASVRSLWDAALLRGRSRTLRQRVKTFLGARPTLLFPLFRLRPAFIDLLVTRSTDLCVEGFPRSANSFAVGAVQHAQPQPIDIAHHTHVPANAMRACEYGIPTVVLIRPPYDAIVSQIALAKAVRSAETASESPRQRITFAAWVHAWRSFYRSLVPDRDHDRLLVVPFAAAIRDMGQVIECVNARFGTDLVPFDHTEAAVAAVHAERGTHAGPNDRRDRLKAETRVAFDEALRADATLRHRMDAAEQLYAAYVEASPVAVDDPQS